MVMGGGRGCCTRKCAATSMGTYQSEQCMPSQVLPCAAARSTVSRAQYSTVQPWADPGGACGPPAPLLRFPLPRPPPPSPPPPKKTQMAPEPSAPSHHAAFGLQPALPPLSPPPGPPYPFHKCPPPGPKPMNAHPPAGRPWLSPAAAAGHTPFSGWSRIPPPRSCQRQHSCRRTPRAARVSSGPARGGGRCCPVMRPRPAAVPPREQGWLLLLLLR